MNIILNRISVIIRQLIEKCFCLVNLGFFNSDNKIVKLIFSADRRIIYYNIFNFIA